jgi:PhnB protein
MRPIAVNLDVPDIDEAVAFYRDTLGFAEGLHIPELDGGTRYATVWQGEATIMFHGYEHIPPERRPFLGTGVTLYIDLGGGDVDVYYRDLTGKGVEVVKPLKDEYWGARDFTIADNNGYHITFARQIQTLTPEQMLEKLRTTA